MLIPTHTVPDPEGQGARHRVALLGKPRHLKGVGRVALVRWLEGPLAGREALLLWSTLEEADGSDSPL